MYLDRVETPAPLRFYLHPGSRVPAHCSATGKLFLSQMAPAQRRRLLANVPLEAFTANTLTSFEAVDQELDQVKAQGYAFDNEEFLPGLLCLGVLVPAPSGNSNMGLAVQAPIMRFPKKRLCPFSPSCRQRQPLLPASMTTFHRKPTMTDLSQLQPSKLVNVRDVFGIDSGMVVPAFAERTEHVPAIDKAYRLNPRVTLAVLAGFAHNRRVVIQGLHGTGKSTHIEQVAARLNWPCVRVNLDGHVGRMDLVGKDAIALKDCKQVTQFQEGFFPGHCSAR